MAPDGDAETLTGRRASMTPEQICAVALAVAAALEHAHRHKVLHRDIKTGVLGRQDELHPGSGIIDLDLRMARGLSAHHGGVLTPFRRERHHSGEESDVETRRVHAYERRQR